MAAILLAAWPVLAQESTNPPAKPTGLTGIIANDQVTLSWNDSGDDSITGYQVLRRDKSIHGSGQFVVHVDETGTADTSYTGH